MSPKQKQAIEKIRSVVASETDPKKLSKLEYLEVIEEIAADLEGMIEMTRAELEDEGVEL